MVITEILRRIWLFSENKICQQTINSTHRRSQLIVAVHNCHICFYSLQNIEGGGSWPPCPCSDGPIPSRATRCQWYVAVLCSCWGEQHAHWCASFCGFFTSCARKTLHNERKLIQNIFDREPTTYYSGSRKTSKQHIFPTDFH